MYEVFKLKKWEGNNCLENISVFLFASLYFSKGKGKAIPLQASTGPEGSRRLTLPDFKTIGVWRW